ncbi:flippase [Nodosilinea sp. LEGE 07298]|uniref:flippase n=1 Tax=Nodosilinea sp. LEGE 07298 TaxID=2777970 RepID=UPI0018801FC1|nr:flippase [Nodosilinea sp. LEGE 07298]MBE9112104.1 flippase [Nodosilinea sp. LEGE 07298]
MAQKLVGNTSWMFVDKIFRAVGELTIGVWLARYLGPQQFGSLNFAIAFVALFTPIYSLGLDKIVVRDIVQHPEHTETTLGSALGLRLIAGMLGATVTIGLIMRLRPSEPLLQGLVGLMALGIVFQVSDVVTFWFQSQIQAKRDIVARSSAYGATSLARVGCILNQASLITIGFTYVLEPVIRAVGLFLVYWRTEDITKRWRFSLRRSVELLHHSWPLILSGVAIMVYMRIDQVMLGQLANDEAVGVYSAAVRLSEGWYFVPITIASSVFPAIVKLKHSDERGYQQQLQKLFRVIVALSYCAILVLTLFSKPIIATLFGADYIDSSRVLLIHAWSGVFVSLGTVRSLWMATENLLVLSFLFTLVGAISNVLLNYFLIPRFSAVGASAATLFSYFLSAYALGFLVPSTRKMTFIMSKAIFLR